jgi:hypothetical protein
MSSSEALALVALVANGPKYRERLQELIAATEKADVAIANLKVAEKASAEKLEAAEALLGSLTSQTDEIQAKNAEAEAKIAAAAAALSHRAGEFESVKQQHADEVARSLEMFRAREAELNERQVVQDADFDARAKDLHGVEAKLRNHHSGLRDIITATRQALAAV